MKKIEYLQREILKEIKRSKLIVKELNTSP